MGGHREAIRDKRRDVRTSKGTQWGTERPEKGHIEGPAKALALALSSLPLPYGIRVTTITWLRTTVWAACPCPTAYALLRTTVWAACHCPTAYALLLLHHYVLLCEQLALALRHTHCYYYMTTYYCVSSLPFPYGIRVTTITWLRTTVWAACPCPTAYALLLLHHYVLLCEQLALALRHTRYYYYITTYYCVSSLPLSYGIRVTIILSLRTTVWAASPCPTAYALLLLHHYVLLCEQLALALRHTRYYYYITSSVGPKRPFRQTPFTT